jgi:hypothetical protein
MKHQDRPEDTDFDLRARAELALAFEPGEPPPICCATRPGTPVVACMRCVPP